MDLTPKRLILDLLATAPRRSMPVAALIAAADLFELSENCLRVTLARLRAAGIVDLDERGRYRLAERSASVGRQVSAWREIEQRVRKWNGGWVGVHTAAVSRSERRAHRHGDRALRLLGFERLEAGLHLRPDNLSGGVGAVRQQLHELGLDGKAIVFGVTALDDRAEQRARRLWDTRALRDGYRASLGELQKSERRLGSLPAHEALVESFVLGGHVLRQLVLDPLLPEPLIVAGERQALVDAMSRYDRVGRSCWTSFLRQAVTDSASKRVSSVRNVRGEAA
ncbi:MAG: PaaX family transcriptional regulator [Deltaproteobacteria bacterium]|nr:PaaX family transcriptional regulator [Deltaproteobacteria bacterium]